MLADPQRSIRHAVRRYLGTDTIKEHLMSVLESLQQLAAQQQAASAAQLTSFTNLQGAVQRLEAAVRDGEVSPEIASAVQELKTGFDTMLQAAQSADDGYEPTTEPVPPVEGEDPTVPVEGEPVTGESTSRRR